MAKDREKQSAYLLYVVQMRTAKEVAALVNVQEKTVGEWIKAGNWKSERMARMNTDKNRADKVKEVIDNLADQSIEITKELEAAKLLRDKESIFDLNKQLVAISQQVAMYNKVLTNIEKDSKISLDVYLKIMDMVFNDLQNFDNSLYMKSLDFQTHHMQQAVLIYG